jgi:hypothetical protein
MGFCKSVLPPVEQGVGFPCSRRRFLVSYLKVFGMLDYGMGETGEDSERQGKYMPEEKATGVVRMTSDG